MADCSTFFVATVICTRPVFLRPSFVIPLPAPFIPSHHFPLQSLTPGDLASQKDAISRIRKIRRADGRTDGPSYRDARTHLKIASLALQASGKSALYGHCLFCRCLSWPFIPLVTLDVTETSYVALLCTSSHSCPASFAFFDTVRLVRTRPNRQIAYLLYYLSDCKDITHVKSQ